MRAGYFPGIRAAEFRADMPEPQIEKADQVKIRVRCCGICGSEVHAYHGKHPFRIPPIVSGHEAAGDVVEVGAAVTDFKVGDRVVVEPITAAASAGTAGTGCIMSAPIKRFWARTAGAALWAST